MYQIISKKEEIAKYQKIFKSIICHNANIIQERKIGHTGCMWIGEIHCDEKNKIWYHNRISGKTKKRFWNGFGFYDKMTDDVKLRIITEINFTVEGINRSVAGLFLKNDKNEIFIGHSGKINIKNESGKLHFWKNYNGSQIELGKNDRLAIIGSLNSNGFYSRILKFIDEVHRIKNLASVYNDIG